jgi:hypothetical protein
MSYKDFAGYRGAVVSTRNSPCGLQKEGTRNLFNYGIQLSQNRIRAAAGEIREQSANLFSPAAA